MLLSDGELALLVSILQWLQLESFYRQVITCAWKLNFRLASLLCLALLVADKCDLGQQKVGVDFPHKHLLLPLTLIATLFYWLLNECAVKIGCIIANNTA